jgi:hypothetical protein
MAAGKLSEQQIADYHERTALAEINGPKRCAYFW